MPIDLPALREARRTDPAVAAVLAGITQLRVRKDRLRLIHLQPATAKKGGEPLPWAELVRVLGLFETAGVGLLLQPLNKHAACFRWFASPHAVLDAIRADRGELAPQDYFDPAVGRAAEVATTPARTAVPEPPEGWVEHRLRLRAEMEVKLTLPDDLTEDEAIRLGYFLRSLPLPPQRGKDRRGG